MAEPPTGQGVSSRNADTSGIGRKSVVTTLFAIAVWTLGGCGLIGGSVSDETTINQSQAEARIDELIVQSTAGLDPKPRLVRNENWELADKCIDPADGGSEDRIIVTKSYWLRDIPKFEPNARIAEQIKANLERHGHRIDPKTNGLGTEKPEIFARSRPDDFLMSLEWNASGALSFGATSPCIWQTGTPGVKPTLD